MNYDKLESPEAQYMHLPKNFDDRHPSMGDLAQVMANIWGTPQASHTYKMNLKERFNSKDIHRSQQTPTYTSKTQNTVNPDRCNYR